jgi:putative endonuclease
MIKYFLYIIRCHDQTLYTGITTDLERRIDEHNFSSLGARYTRARRPVKLVYFKKFNSRSLATQEEFRIKKLSRLKKIEMIKLNKPSKF